MGSFSHSGNSASRDGNDGGSSAPHPADGFVPSGDDPDTDGHQRYRTAAQQEVAAATDEPLPYRLQPLQVFGAEASRQPAAVNRVVVLPSGGLAVLCGERLVRLLDDRGEMRHEWTTETPVRELAVVNGELVVATAAGVVRLINPITGDELRRHTLGQEVEAAAPLPDGLLVAFGSGGHVRLDLASGVASASGLDDALGDTTVMHFTASPDGRHVLTADARSRLWLHDLQAGTHTELLVFPRGTWLTAAAFSPDGARLAIGEANGDLRIRELADPESHTRIASGTAVTALVWSDADTLASGQSLAIRNADGSPRVEYDPDFRMQSLAARRDGWIIGGRRDGTLHWIDPATASAPASDPLSDVVDMAVATDGSWFVTLHDGGEVVDWRVADGSSRVRIHGAAMQEGLALLADERIVTGADTRSLPVLVVLDADDQPVEIDGWTNRLSTSRDRHRVAGFRERDSTIVCRELAPDGELLVVAEHKPTGGVVEAMELMPAGDRVAVATDDGMLRFVVLATGSPDATIQTRTAASDRKDGEVRCLAVDASERSLACGLANGAIRLLDVGRGEWAHELTGHSEAIASLDFSADGTRLVSTATNGVMRVWEVATGQLLAIHHGVEGPWVARFRRPYRDELLVGNRNGTITQWRLVPAD